MNELTDTGPERPVSRPEPRHHRATGTFRAIDDYISDVAHHRRQLGSMTLDHVITALFDR